LNNTYVSRQKVLPTDVRGPDLGSFKIYSLSKICQPIYDSGDIEMIYLTKLVLL